MPQYFFNVRGLGRALADDVGQGLPDDDAAWQQATEMAGELFREIGEFRLGEEWELEVADEKRKPLFSIQIRAVKK